MPPEIILVMGFTLHSLNYATYAKSALLCKLKNGTIQGPRYGFHRKGVQFYVTGQLEIPYLKIPYFALHICPIFDSFHL